MTPDVEVVLINYKRPANVAAILAALRSQTVPARITVVETPVESFQLRPDTLGLIDRYIRLSHDYGPYSRYVSAFGYDLPYTYFHDDDMLPGTQCIEHFRRYAVALGDFGVLGQLGRRIVDGVYRPVDVPRSGSLVPVDCCIRGYFVKTQHLHHVLRLKWSIPWEGSIEDDLLLCAAMRMYGRLPILLTPTSADAAEQMNIQELPSPYAMSHRPSHYLRRTNFLRRLNTLGWQPLSK